MASTILYKFRSGTTFEALPLPGSAARLFDVKKAIVKAKKLDSGSMEFDLGVRNADTNEEYSNESMLLPRGTRLIVQRLPAQRGHGFLARMARNEQAGTGMATQGSSAPNSFYTIESRAGDDDEFVQAPANEESELAALQAATNLQSAGGPAMTGGGYAASRSNFPSSGGGSGGGGPPKRNFHAPQQFRPNADPELREQEKKLQPKKGRTTGIPRTFQSLQAPAQTEGEDGDDTAVAVLQPNSQGFKDLVSRGGGRSENIAGTRHDLDYALKLTASTVPDYLLCPICNKALRNATLLPWDPEGRSTCESCIRDALTQSGFRCPLTGMEGVSPDDLLPNIGLRKAAEMFIKGVMDKVDEVEQMRVEEDENVGAETAGSSGLNSDILEGDGIEKGVIVSRKSSIVRKKFEEDDPFADDDDFGGDVFAVEVDKPTEEEMEEKKEETKEADATSAAKDEDKTASENMEADSNRADKDETNPNSRSDPSSNGNAPDSSTSAEAKVGEKENDKQEESSPPPPKRRRRGPPAGYTMGPAGYNRNKDGGDRRGGGRYQGHDGGYRGRGSRGGHSGGRDNDYNNRGGGGRHDGDGGNGRGQDDNRNRGPKRSRNDDHSADGSRDTHSRHDRYDDRDSRYNRSDEHDDRAGGGRGSHRGGYNRGGRGRWGGRGGGGGGGYRGGHGRRH